MTLDQLRVFVAVADRQHVTRAAEALNLAQSAASAAIAALEAEHATKLFDRIGRRIELTEAGRLFLPEARAVLARAEAAARHLAELGTLARGTLAVHASQTIAGYWLPRHLAAFHTAYPAIAIRLTVANTAQVAHNVHEGLADLGFVEGAIDDPQLAAIPVARDQLILVTAPTHPWVTASRASARRPLAADKLAQSPWVLREPGSGTRSEFEAALAARGIDPATLPIALELPSNESVRAAVEAGLGATALSASVAAASIEAGLLKHIRFALPERKFHALLHKDRQTTRAARALLEIIK